MMHVIIHEATMLQALAMMNVVLYNKIGRWWYMKHEMMTIHETMIVHGWIIVNTCLWIIHLAVMNCVNVAIIFEVMIIHAGDDYNICVTKFMVMVIMIIHAVMIFQWVVYDKCSDENTCDACSDNDRVIMLIHVRVIYAVMW